MTKIMIQKPRSATMRKLSAASLLIIGCFLKAPLSQAGTVTLVGNGAGGGPVFVSSSSNSIGLGTRVRIGTFTDLTALTTSISNYLAGSANYATTFAALSSNFVDIGTGVTNYGASSQSAVGNTTFVPSTSQFGFNATTSLSINGVTGSYSTFNGTITGVNYSLSTGASKNLYIWTAFNDEIGIVRNADGSGTAAWTTPTSDGANITMNLSGLQATAGGTLQTSEILLGSFVDYATGSDLIRLQAAIPEPSSLSLLVISTSVLLFRRRKTYNVKGK
jgi:hypothetical protein